MIGQVVLTDEQIIKIHETKLFRGMPDAFYTTLLGNLEYTVDQYKKGAVVIKQDTKCAHLHILIEGRLEVNIIDVAGNNVKIEHIIAPRAFATPHLFDEENLFPATFTAIEDSLLFRVSKEATFELLSREPDLMRNFLKVSGNCKACTVNRLRILSYRSIRSRFTFYLYNHKIDETHARLDHNQTQLAEYIGSTRPALANEIRKMIDEGLIAVDGQKVDILRPALLLKYI